MNLLEPLPTAELSSESHSSVSITVVRGERTLEVSETWYAEDLISSQEAREAIARLEAAIDGLL